MKEVGKGKNEVISYEFLTLAFRRKTMTVIVAEDCKNAVSSENYLSVSTLVLSVVEFEDTKSDYLKAICSLGLFEMF